jgi:hypothetical protein
VTNNIEWFSSFCDLLLKEKSPTTNGLIAVLGIENKSIKKENRGSKFLIPFDTKLNWIAINPDLSENEPNRPIESLGFGSSHLDLKFNDLLKLFPDYKVTSNVYDGGTQFFFYPVPEYFEFSAISSWIDEEKEEINDYNSLTFNRISFHFGENLFQARDGFHLRRI